MSVVIKAENLSKQYRLGLVGTGTLREDLEGWWYRMRGKEDPTLMLGEENDRSKAGTSNHVWALHDINFEVKQGEVLGIVGKNGAGKSTLLKLLSRVTAPTTGTIKAKGRIASLLEVGTGFHPELTGRENIYLNGAIMGMRRAEISRKLEEIVDFAGVERYLDTPVKRYSSGMYVRLAFAVAAHLEPEILIIDEVLAVGDAEFQKKALGKMKDVSKGQGRTVLFVSHNMASVKTLCTRAMLLENGIIRFEGDTDSVINRYLSVDSSDEIRHSRRFSSEFDFPEAKLHSIIVRNVGKSENTPISESDEIEIITELELKNVDAQRYHLTFHLNTSAGEGIFAFSHRDILLKSNSVNKIRCLVPSLFINPGEYSIHVFVVRDKRTHVFIEKDILRITIIDRQREIGTYMGKEPGFVRPKFKWFLEE